MRRSFLRAACVSLCATTVLAAVPSASAMIAVDVIRVPLRAAAQAAASCDEIRDGRYVVHLSIDSEGRGHDASLAVMPEGLSPMTERCVLVAFEQQSYGAIASGRTGGIQVNFPFVVAGHADPR